MLRIARQAVQSHKRMEPVDEKNKICWFGCPCGDDSGRSSRAGGRGKSTRDHSEPGRVDSEAGEETGTRGAIAVLLRSRPHRVCRVLAASSIASEVRSGGAHASAGEIGRAGEDRSARCVEVGAELSGRRV